ncbi:hypothetical protein GCK72_011171 [Caenorhabditis remanei]|uniref:Uncharacterized protein n=1 Tax=Caenorhabditis remanei TaxID=31234 RepID=A0A6A5H6U0_CAERE|nr:hypothetical protein GCK72_011171 [Caenorhabditis remanei]KAF1762907.1 hypothetical protein GCK72_011171 [Caenorhabditis remanei]
MSAHSTAMTSIENISLLILKIQDSKVQKKTSENIKAPKSTSTAYPITTIKEEVPDSDDSENEGNPKQKKKKVTVVEDSEVSDVEEDVKPILKTEVAQGSEASEVLGNIDISEIISDVEMVDVSPADVNTEVIERLVTEVERSPDVSTTVVKATDPPKISEVTMNEESPRIDGDVEMPHAKSPRHHFTDVIFVSPTVVNTQGSSPKVVDVDVDKDSSSTTRSVSESSDDVEVPEQQSDEEYDTYEAEVIQVNKTRIRDAVDEDSDEDRQLGYSVMSKVANIFSASSDKSGPSLKKQKKHMALQMSSSEDSDSDDTTQMTMAPTSSSLSEALLEIGMPSGAPSMRKHRDEGVYNHCVSIGKKIKAEHTKEQINLLTYFSTARNELYQRYCRSGWLHETNKTKMEQLPIYAFLMAPLTKNVYMEGLKNDKIKTANDVHVKIFEASRFDDSTTAECLQMWISGSIQSSTFKICLSLIREANEIWRDLASGKIKHFVKDMKIVDSLEKIPDFGFLVCFQKLPDIATIQSKHLNCLIIEPSFATTRLILSHTEQCVRASVHESAYRGNQGILNYYCFGPKIKPLQDDVRRKTSTNLVSAFRFSMGDYSAKFFTNPENRLYAIYGYF